MIRLNQTSPNSCTALSNLFLTYAEKKWHLLGMGGFEKSIRNGWFKKEKTKFLFYLKLLDSRDLQNPNETAVKQSGKVSRDSFYFIR